MNDVILVSPEYLENKKKYEARLAERRVCEFPDCSNVLSCYNSDVFCEQCKSRLVREDPRYSRPTQRLCRKGHDKWVVGTNLRGECNECRRMRKEEPRVDRSKRAGEDRFPLRGLLAAKEKAGVSYRQCAEELRLDRKTVQNYALLRCWCNEKNARQLAELLGVSFEELLTESEEGSDVEISY